MFYDPQAKPTPPADHLTLAGLIAWLQYQPPEQRYDFSNCNGECLLDSYITAVTGKPSRPHHMTHWVTCGGPVEYGLIAIVTPWTYGAALTRAREVAERL